MKVKEFCSKCKKKINITNKFICQCENIFCSEHRYIESHDCITIENKIKQERNKLETEMPKIECQKLEII